MLKIQWDMKGHAARPCFILSDQRTCVPHTPSLSTLHEGCQANFIKHGLRKRKIKRKPAWKYLKKGDAENCYCALN